MKSSQRLSDLIEDARNSADSAAANGSDDSSNVLLQRFLEQIDEACDDRYRQHHGEVALVSQLLETFTFIRARTPGTTLVRLISAPSRNGQAPNSTLEVVSDDRPFIVDTVGLFLDFTGLQVVSSCYATIVVTRDKEGQLLSVEKREDEGAREVLARFEIMGRLDDVFQSTIVDAVRERLGVASEAVRDFELMKSALDEIAAGYGRATEEGSPPHVIARDVQVLVDWLKSDNFVLMGVGEYATDPSDSEGAGYGFTSLSGENQTALIDRVGRVSEDPSQLEHWLVTYKSQEESLIHRAGKIDNFVFKNFDEDGTHVGYSHVRGLFTFKAIQTLGGQIPFVRLKLGALLQQAGHSRGSIKWKAFSNAFNSIPVEYLFEAQPEQIAEIIDTILYVERSRELRTHVVVDTDLRKGLYFLVLPRQGYSEGLRSRIENILIDGLGATYSDSRVYFGKFDTVLLTFFFTATQRLKEFSREQLDERVRAVAGTWDDRFRRVLIDVEGAERATELFSQYRDAFSEDYQLVTPPSEAAHDVHQLERVRSNPDREIAFSILQGDGDAAQGMCRLRVYLKQNVYLSSLLPMLDDFGLQIVDQAAFRVRPGHERELFTQTFRVANVTPDSALLVRSEQVVEALEMVFSRTVDTDQLNQLIVDVGVGWRDVNLIRAYVNYMRQLGVGNTFAFMSTTFRQNAEVTRQLLEYYRIRFDPKFHVEALAEETELEARTRSSSAAEEEILASLAQVPSQAQDEFIRRLLNLFSSTLRTTRFQEVSTEQRMRLAIKIDSQALVVGSEPRPWREIFVHHHETEGIHIRGGRLARGGIRWSDRLVDYREEVLGLMRTQMVKNVLIVPVGAKGGFVVRRPKSGRDERLAQADAMYQVYINALLDLTDNVVDGVVVHPPDVLCYDGEDPYLVVAADKGTAHLSDTANGISLKRGFWLNDAFASGGSNGYDHKALGITARGAWECVKRHFLELGLDPERDPITAIGVGDMSGDVFGNGMLCSETIQLKAAFNHLHIFIDPTPAAQETFVERQRLFKLRRSTWSDYDVSKISSGGGVYDRNLKTITLEPAGAELLGFTECEQRPQEVVRAILRLKVDLLWNGGIGTYIKSSREDNRDVGDVANEAVRVDSREVRSRVIGEGGNLGLTQQARIDLALRGVQLNTDFVDNSAGVNCSDHEVNLKILFESEIRAGRLTLEERNRWLARLSEDVCTAVLDSNNNQALAISLDEVRSRHDLFSFERAIKALEDRGVVDRVNDHLPDLETLFTRQPKGQGLARPELATLNAYTKMQIYDRLLEASPKSTDQLGDHLRSYFPEQLVELCGEHFDAHLLAREITMTVITNLLVDQAGVGFCFDAVRESGSQLVDVVRAYFVLTKIFQAASMKETVLDRTLSVKTDDQYEAVLAIEEALHRSVSWIGGGRDGGRLGRVESEHGIYRDAMTQYEAVLPQCLSKPEQKRFKQSLDRYRDASFEDDFAERLAKCTYSPAGLRIVDICRSSGASVADVAPLYFRIGQETQIFPLVRMSDEKRFIGRWESLALRVIRNTLLDSLWSLTHDTVSQLAEGSGPDWIDRGVAIAQQHPQYEEMRLELKTLKTEELSVAALHVVSVRLAHAFGA